TDLGFEPEDPASMPWWRRKKGVDPAFDTPVAREQLTDVIVSPAEPNPFDLLAELDKAESAVRRFTGEIAPASRGLHDEDFASVPTELPDPETVATPPAAAANCRPYRLPAAASLQPGTPPKTRTAANDEAIAAITGVLTQIQV